MSRRSPSNAPVSRGSRGVAAIMLAIVGASIALAMESGRPRHEPAAEHGAAIALNIAGVALSAHVSFH